MKATVTALQMLRSPEQVAELRGLTVREVLGLDRVGDKAGNEAAEGAPEEAPGEAAEGGPVAAEAT